MKNSDIIQQMIPADRWYAMVGPGKPARDIVCFALVSGHGSAAIRPVCFANSSMVFADELPGFSGIDRYEY